jgi:glycosyltransferase involved in cell wall biosynthesis
VFARSLPRYGYAPVWLLQPARPDLSGLRTTWNGAPAFVTCRRHWKGAARHCELFSEYLRVGNLALQEYSIDLVQARTGIPEALAAYCLARRHRKPFVFQYSFPTALARRRVLQESRLRWMAGPAAHAETSLIGFLMRRAALALLISGRMCQEWAARGVRNGVAFPLGADPAPGLLRENPVAEAKDTYVYFGSMSPWRRLEFLLEVHRLVRRALPKAHLLMVGDHHDSDLPARVTEMGLEQAVTFVGKVPRAGVPAQILRATCSVAPIPPEPIYLLSSATKVVESLALGVPVVANREIDDQRELLEASGGGLCPAYDTREFARAIISLLRDPAAGLRLGQAGSRYVAEHRSYEVLAASLAVHYDNVLARHASTGRTDA